MCLYFIIISIYIMLMFIVIMVMFIVMLFMFIINICTTPAAMHKLTNSI